MTTPDPQAGRFTLAQRLKSFRYAWHGIAFMLRTQHNARIHLLITLAVCALGWASGISATDWRWLIVAIVLVWFAELINTAVEYVCDLISRENDDRIKRAKDIGAGAVLICAIGAALIGVLTFWPYLLRMI